MRTARTIALITYVLAAALGAGYYGFRGLLITVAASGAVAIYAALDARIEEEEADEPGDTDRKPRQ